VRTENYNTQSVPVRQLRVGWYIEPTGTGRNLKEWAYIEQT